MLRRIVPAREAEIAAVRDGLVVSPATWVLANREVCGRCLLIFTSYFSQEEQKAGILSPVQRSQPCLGACLASKDYPKITPGWIVVDTLPPGLSSEQEPSR